MPTTRAFKSGHSQAVRIPAELAYAEVGADLTITRSGDIITIIPAKGSLANTVATLRAMPKPTDIEQREPFESPRRADD